MAETLNKRIAARRTALLAVLAPMALLVAALALVTLGIRRGRQPPHALGTELAERSLDRLEAVDNAAAAAEIRPLIEPSTGCSSGCGGPRRRSSTSSPPPRTSCARR